MRIVIAIEKQNMGYRSKRLRLRESLHIVNGLTTLRWSSDYMRNSMCLSIIFEATSIRIE